MKKFLITIAIIFLIIIGAIFIKFVIPEIKYSYAIKWLDNISNGAELTDVEYEEYLTYFVENSTYKENDINSKKLKYIKAQKLLDENYLEEAMKLYQELDNYENSNKEIEKINELSSLKDEKINEAKKIAAFEITKLIHGEEEAKKAEEASNALFNGKGSLENMPTTKLDNPYIPIIDVIVLTKLAPSKSQAKTLINQGGITLNDIKISDITYTLSDNDYTDGYAILKKGKKIFHKLEK